MWATKIRDVLLRSNSACVTTYIDGMVAEAPSLLWDFDRQVHPGRTGLGRGSRCFGTFGNLLGSWAADCDTGAGVCSQLSHGQMMTKMKGVAERNERIGHIVEVQ